VLTGLGNRRYGRRLLEEMTRQMEARGLPLSLMLCDIDAFKRFNDRWGHACGDRVLIRVARLLDSEFGEPSRVVRWGGEEFLAILPGVRLGPARDRVERLREGIERATITYRGRQHCVTVTCGVTQVQPEEVVDDAIDRADRALYAGKLAGRNCVTTA